MELVAWFIFGMCAGIHAVRAYDLYAVVLLSATPQSFHPSTKYYKDYAQAIRAANVSASSDSQISNVCRDFPVNPCDSRLGRCTNLRPSVVQCSCPPGYTQLLPANTENTYRVSTTCVDIDECTGNTTACGQHTETCKNLQGSYNCTCKPGYHISADKLCIPARESSTLLSSTYGVVTFSTTAIFTVPTVPSPTKVMGRQYTNEQMSTVGINFGQFATLTSTSAPQTTTAAAGPISTSAENSSTAEQQTVTTEMPTTTTASNAQTIVNSSSFASTPQVTTANRRLGEGTGSTTSGGQSVHGPRSSSVFFHVFYTLFLALVVSLIRGR